MKNLIIIIILFSSCIKSTQKLSVNYKGINEDFLKAAFDGDLNSILNLLDKGAFINFEDTCGDTALMRASRKEYTEIVKLLLEKDADVNIRDEDEWTALMYASNRGNIEIVKLLIEKGASINIKDKLEGYTALMRASIQGYTDVVKILLEKGADINILDNCGCTVLELLTNLIKNLNIDEIKSRYVNILCLIIQEMKNQLNLLKLYYEDESIKKVKPPNEKLNKLLKEAYDCFDNIVKILLDNNAKFNYTEHREIKELMLVSEKLKKVAPLLKENYINIAYLLLNKAKEDYIKLFISLDKAKDAKDIKEAVKYEIKSYINLLVKILKLPENLFYEVISRIK